MITNGWRIGMDVEYEWMKCRNERRIEIHKEKKGIKVKNERIIGIKE